MDPEVPPNFWYGSPMAHNHLSSSWQSFYTSDGASVVGESVQRQRSFSLELSVVQIYRSVELLCILKRNLKTELFDIAHTEGANSHSLTPRWRRTV